MIERTEIQELVAALIPEIGDEYRAPDCEGDSEPSMQLTIGADDLLQSWGYQTGDNSFTGGAYGFPHWAMITLCRDSDPTEVANEILSQLRELAEW